MPSKPCVGQFSEEVVRSLEENTDRAQWRSHPCAICELQVGAQLKAGKWTPDQHWPTISYATLKRSKKKR
jgi:hypothetical protein